MDGVPELPQYFFGHIESPASNRIAAFTHSRSTTIKCVEGKNMSENRTRETKQTAEYNLHLCMNFWTNEQQMRSHTQKPHKTRKNSTHKNEIGLRMNGRQQK